jgi:hypothetical protein
MRDNILNLMNIGALSSTTEVRNEKHTLGANHLNTIQTNSSKNYIEKESHI